MFARALSNGFARSVFRFLPEAAEGIRKSASRSVLGPRMRSVVGARVGERALGESYTNSWGIPLCSGGELP